MTSDPSALWVFDDDAGDDGQAPAVVLGAGGDGDGSGSSRLWWPVVGVAVLVVVAGGIGIVVFNDAAPRPGPGTVTARQAAAGFVRAIDAGDGSAVRGLTCATFTDEALSVARSGRDTGIGFALHAVSVIGRDTASATVVRTIRLPGGAAQRGTQRFVLVRRDARWTVCGTSP